MKVYALVSWTHDGASLRDVFDSREKAHKAFYETLNNMFYSDEITGGDLVNNIAELHFWDNKEHCEAEYELKLVEKELK